MDAISHMTKLSITVVTTAALLAVVGLPQALGAGGLSMTPAIIEHLATPGAVGSVVVSNATKGPLAITLTPRPWRQARSGAVAPNRRKKLTSQVRVSAGSFSLPAGAKRTVALTLIRTGAGRSVYGSLEIVGTPPKPKKKAGIIAAFRLVGSLRLNPPAAARALRLALGAARVTGKGAKRKIAVALTNRGNTVDPITGSARITGSRGSRTVSVTAKRIVPGATIDLPLGAVKGLAKGSYRVRVGLFQGGKAVLTQTRKFRIR
jgi:hypothetical protein